jgi:transcriptional regulator with XRE-family HTH domain
MRTAKELGSEVKRLRKLAHLTQQQIAMRVSVTDTQICNWENGTYRIPEDKYLVITKILKAYA